MVTQAGKVADVTLQATCSSVDESVLKVCVEHTHTKKCQVVNCRNIFFKKKKFNSSRNLPAKIGLLCYVNV